MELFKIDLFRKEYNIDFPGLRNLSTVECEDLTNEITKKNDIQNITSLYELIENKEAVFFIDDRFDLLTTLELFNIKYKSKVYINWNLFTNIDVIDIHILDKYFLDIWYPATDDIDVFDESLNWFLTVRHDGNVFLLK